jgi:hypothetical protein
MKTFVNLLPFEYRRKGLLSRRLMQWSLVWIMCATIAFGAWWLKYDRYCDRLHESSTAERAYLPLAKLMRERKEMQAELKELQAQDTIFGQLLDERPLVTLIGMTSRSARRCNGRLVLSQLFFDRQEERRQGDGREVEAQEQDKKQKQQAAKGSQPWALVRFKGEALDNLAVATFAAALRDTRLFRRVELRSSVGNKSGDTDVRSFLVECEI